jgi:hypothetical protein
MITSALTRWRHGDGGETSPAGTLFIGFENLTF